MTIEAITKFRRKKCIMQLGVFMMQIVNQPNGSSFYDALNCGAAVSAIKGQLNFMMAIQA